MSGTEIRRDPALDAYGNRLLCPVCGEKDVCIMMKEATEYDMRVFRYRTVPFYIQFECNMEPCGWYSRAVFS